MQETGSLVFVPLPCKEVGRIGLCVSGSLSVSQMTLVSHSTGYMKEQLMLQFEIESLWVQN